MFGACTPDLYPLSGYSAQHSAPGMKGSVQAKTSCSDAATTYLPGTNSPLMTNKWLWSSEESSETPAVVGLLPGGPHKLSTQKPDVREVQHGWEVGPAQVRKGCHIWLYVASCAPTCKCGQCVIRTELTVEFPGPE